MSDKGFDRRMKRMNKFSERYPIRLSGLPQGERLIRAIARRLPRTLAYHCADRVAGATLGPDEHPDEHTVPQMLGRWRGLPGSPCGWCGRQHVGRCAAYREQVEQT